MHWIVQNNLRAGEDLVALVEILRHAGLSFTTVMMKQSDGTLWPDVDPTGPTVAYGSVGLARVACERGWQPGSFRNDNHRYQVCAVHWAREMLNAEAQIGAFGDVEPPGQRVFIRPAEDTKFFQGGVMDSDDVRAWRDALVRGERSPVKCSPRMSAATVVVCGALIPIHRECRFFVVDGAVVAWSTYKEGDDLVAVAEVDDVSMAYARACVQLWQPARAFVLDTALTADGPRIVEVNCINSAGFYGADIERVVWAIEAMEPWADA